VVAVSAYNFFGETISEAMLVAPAAAAGGPYVGQTGVPLTVSGAGSIDESGTITGYVWNWGDGTGSTSSASTTASHTYAGPGTFTLTLTVTDDFAASGSAKTTATIVPAPQPPGTPGSPSPTDGTPGVSSTPTLSWNASGATSYDVQFGAANPPPQVATGQTTGSYTPAPLAPATTYYWQITARNSDGAATGPIWSFTTLSATSDATDIVVFAADIPSKQIHGSWTTTSDVTSANGLKLATPDAGWSTTNAPLVAPADYVDVMFNADAGIPYTLWLRMRALNDNKYNDALWVQFSDALVASAPVYPLNSTSGLLVNLATDVTAVSLHGWGWQNAAYWLQQPATITFAASGPHTLRIQVREDGVQFDQIVLSPGTYLTAPPGPLTNDSTILPRTGQPAAANSPSPANAAADVSTTATLLTWSATGATSYDVQFGSSNPPPQVVTGTIVASYVPAPLTAATTYYWRIVARNSSGSTIGPLWSFKTAPAAPTPAAEIVIYASDIPAGQLHGSWRAISDATSPNGLKLGTPDAAWSTLNSPLAAPTDYIDVTFDAEAGRPYTLWLRMRAINDNKYNDAVWAQFSDALVDNAPAYPMNSTSGLLVNLATDVTAASLVGWGWQNGAYWLPQPATIAFAAGGPHTLRIQVREDGVQLDQIVLSPATYLTARPGSQTNDSTIVAK